MVRFDLVLRFPAGVMVSGYSAGTDGLHGETARRRDGKPVVPATAIRGALREGLEAILRGAKQGACEGGSGLAPNAPPGSVEIPCSLGEGDQRCIACRIFGTRRPNIEPHERAFSELVIGNAELQGESAGWVRRPGVAIDRRLRAASNDLLFLQRTAGGGREFRARGRLLDDSLLPYLNAAAEATKHIGAGKSRGLARVDIHVAVTPAEDGARATSVSLPAGDEVRVRLTLESPAFLGEAVNDENAYETRQYVPGSALRGAVGFGLAEMLPDPDTDEPFQKLVAETGALFGFLYPVDPKTPDGEDRLAAPLPITAIGCKREGRKHGTADTLLDRIAGAAVRTAEEAARVEETSTPACPNCGSGPRGAKGYRRLEGGPTTRAVTRAATDRRLRSARDEALFTQVLLEAETVFEGRIRGIPADGAEVRARLEQALSGPLSVGRGRAAGWGQVRVEVSNPWPLRPLRDRKADFDAALARRLEEVAPDFGKVLPGRLVPVTLLSPLLSKVEGGDGEADLLEETGASGCYLRARRFTREGGWDQRTGRMEPALATAAGGVFVLEFPTTAAADEAIQRLETMEKGGVGKRRHQGYGEVVCFDPFLLKRRFSR